MFFRFLKCFKNDLVGPKVSVQLPIFYPIIVSSQNSIQRLNADGFYTHGSWNVLTPWEWYEINSILCTNAMQILKKNFPKKV